MVCETSFNTCRDKLASSALLLLVYLLTLMKSAEELTEQSTFDKALRVQPARRSLGLQPTALFTHNNRLINCKLSRTGFFSVMLGISQHQYFRDIKWCCLQASACSGIESQKSTAVTLGSPRAVRGQNLKIRFLEVFPGPRKCTCKVSSTSAQRSRSFGVVVDTAWTDGHLTGFRNHLGRDYELNVCDSHAGKHVLHRYYPLHSLISATLRGWRRCFVADQLWFMTRIRQEEDSL